MNKNCSQCSHLYSLIDPNPKITNIFAFKPQHTRSKQLVTANEDEKGIQNERIK